MKTSLMSLTIVLITVIFATGCLKTRSELTEGQKKEKLQTSVANLQQMSADSQARFEEIYADLRTLDGKIAALDKSQEGASAQESQKLTEMSDRLAKMDERLALLQTTIEKNDTRLTALEAEAAALRSVLSGKTKKIAEEKPEKNQKSQKEKTSFEVAEEAFKQKKWEDAILGYQKYRELNPKGTQSSIATYKIGVSFQELGMKDEARAFYSEAVNKFPNSDGAKKSQYRLSQLK